jgi:light-regulated signal transduction histidine kinase (bacteriophytochrome)
MSIRIRLTVTYTLLILAVAGLLIAGIYIFMRYAPSYHFAPVATSGGPSLTPVPGAKPSPAGVVAAKPAAFRVSSRTSLLNTLLIGSLITLALLAVLASAAGWLITGRLLRPIRDITSAARLAASGRLEASASQIRVDTVIPDFVVVRGEPTLLTQLVRNLVENAIRHNYPGGTVVVEAVPASDGKVTLRIQNSGAILEPSTLPLLIEPFYRVQGRTQRSGGRIGHGLGLALAEAIARAHGTQLVLAAGDGGGLTATVELVRVP